MVTRELVTTKVETRSPGCGDDGVCNIDSEISFQGLLKNLFVRKVLFSAKTIGSLKRL